MKVEASKLINGIIEYADREVINSLPVAGKWLLGAGVGIMSSRVNEVINSINDNPIAKAMGIVDENGMFDLDLIADNLKQSANKYGKMTIQVPLVGRLTFSEGDVDSLRNYIERN